MTKVRKTIPDGVTLEGIHERVRVLRKVFPDIRFRLGYDTEVGDAHFFAESDRRDEQELEAVVTYLVFDVAKETTR